MENSSVNIMEKCPEMSHSKEAREGVAQLLEVENPSFQGTSHFSGFQREDNHRFSSDPGMHALQKYTRKRVSVLERKKEGYVKRGNREG